MARYLNSNRPLTGYFMICCVVEIQWIVLSQTFSRTPSTNTVGSKVDFVRGDAEAANTAWADLTRGLLKYQGVINDSTKQTLERTLRGSTQLFSELVSHIEEMADETSLDTYAWESMAEALVACLLIFCILDLIHPQKLGSICCVAVDSLSVDLISRLKLLLSDKSPVNHNRAQEASLKCLTVLVQQ